MKTKERESIDLRAIKNMIMFSNIMENVTVIYRGLEYSIRLGVFKIQNRQN